MRKSQDERESKQKKKEERKQSKKKKWSKDRMGKCILPNHSQPAMKDGRYHNESHAMHTYTSVNDLQKK